MSDESIQVWVRNDKGQVYGPLNPTSIELLLDNGIIQGRVQLSTDGSNFVFPGRAPGLRMIFPRELWGDTVVAGDELDAQWKQVSLPPPLPTVGSDAAAPGARHGAAPGAPPGGPVAGPGARAPAAGPGARAPMAGPGAQAAARPFTSAQPNAQARAHRPVSGAAAAPAGPLTADVLFAGPAPARPPGVRPPSAAAPPPAPAGPPAFTIVPPPGMELSSSPAPAPPPALHAPPPAAVHAPPRPGPAAPPVVNASPVSSGAMPSSGHLAERPVAELYYLAAGGGLTGRLTVTASDRSYELWFKKGGPQYVDSSHPDDALENFLLREQLCQPQQLASAHKEKAKFGGDLLAALFALGLMNPNAALQQLAQRGLTLLGHVLLVEKGSFAWSNEELPGAKAIPLGNRWAAYLEQLRKVPFGELQRRMASAMNLPVMKSGGLVPIENLRLTPQEARALTFFDGVRSLAQLIADFPGEADTMLATAWMLKPLELVSFAATPVRVPPPRAAAQAPPVSSPSAARPAPVSSRSGVAAAPSGVASSPSQVSSPSSVVPGPPPAAGVPRPPLGVPGPPPAAVRVPGNPVMPQEPKVSVPYPGQKPSSPRPAGPAAAPPPRPVPAAPPPPRAPVVTAAPVSSSPSSVIAAPPEDMKQLATLFETMKKQTYFEMLGIKKEADAAAVKVAYFKLAKSYHPDTVAPGTPEPLAKAKADIFALVGEANRVLSDPKLKADYLAELNAGGTGEKVDVSAIFQAEEFFQKGCILVKARKYPEAVKMLDDAIKSNGDEGEYYVWRGYAKFFGFSDRKFGQSEAMKDITYGLKKNPNVAAAQFFIGMMAKLNGDTATAKKSFQQCVKLDPNHIDAQRELRMMK